MATQPGAPPPDIDRPVSPDEAPVRPDVPNEPGSPSSPDEVPAEAPAYDEPNPGPDEIPPAL